MQNRYVGDAGDYAKFSLLNALSGLESERLSLGVIWYLFPDERHNGDGRHIGYLQQPALALRDKATHARLGQLVQSGRRSLYAVEREGVLPTGTVYDSRAVVIDGPPSARLQHRSQWFASALNRVSGADLIFFDPDNGIETPALKQSDYKAGKYVFWSEIESAWQMGKSLVVYNHLNRSASATAQTARLRALFADRLTDTGAIISLLFRRGSCRHIWIIAQPSHRDRLVSRVQDFLDRGWSQDTDADFL